MRSQDWRYRLRRVRDTDQGPRTRDHGPGTTDQGRTKHQALRPKDPPFTADVTRIAVLFCSVTPCVFDSSGC